MGFVVFCRQPGNILFDRHGEVKITDFGLSKVMEDANATAMELTSQVCVCNAAGSSSPASLVFARLRPPTR